MDNATIGIIIMRITLMCISYKEARAAAIIATIKYNVMPMADIIAPHMEYFFASSDARLASS
jgi:hypothetical protein